MATNKPTNTTTANAQPSEQTTASKKPLNGKHAQPKRTPRVISDPNQVAQLVMMHLDAVNTKKDELTLTIKGLTDVTRQLARAYAQHTRTIQALQQRVAKLEEKGVAK